MKRGGKKFGEREKAAGEPRAEPRRTHLAQELLHAGLQRVQQRPGAGGAALLQGGQAALQLGGLSAQQQTHGHGGEREEQAQRGGGGARRAAAARAHRAAIGPARLPAASRRRLIQRPPRRRNGAGSYGAAALLRSRPAGPGLKRRKRGVAALPSPRRGRGDAPRAARRPPRGDYAEQIPPPPPCSALPCAARRRPPAGSAPSPGRAVRGAGSSSRPGRPAPIPPAPRAAMAPPSGAPRGGRRHRDRARAARARAAASSCTLCFILSGGEPLKKSSSAPIQTLNTSRHGETSAFSVTHCITPNLDSSIKHHQITLGQTQLIPCKRISKSSKYCEHGYTTFRFLIALSQS